MGLGLKRKRSFDSSPSSTSSFLSPSRASTSPSPNPGRYFNGTMAVEPPYTNPIISSWRFGKSELLSTEMNSRTRKRFRDGRPDQQIIHENTIHKLFDAQRQHPQASPILSRETPQIHHHAAQRSTLHSFWHLPQPASLPRFTSVLAPTLDLSDSIGCEDCERPLAAVDDSHMDSMAVDVREESACHDCGKRVCDMCAVSMSGRKCLNCAAQERG